MAERTQGGFDWAHPFSDFVFDSAQLNPGESSDLIQLIRESYG